MKYYVNYKTLIGKQFEADTYGKAVAYARGYADAKGWPEFRLIIV